MRPLWYVHGGKLQVSDVLIRRERVANLLTPAIFMPTMTNPLIYVLQVDTQLTDALRRADFALFGRSVRGLCAFYALAAEEATRTALYSVFASLNADLATISRCERCVAYVGQTGGFCFQPAECQIP